MSISKELAAGVREHVVSRRGFLSDSFTGLAGVGLASLIGRDAFGHAPVARAEASALAARGLAQYRPRAKRVLQIFCPGGASHMDLWEHKPSLAKHHGKPLPGEENAVTFQGKNGNVMQSPWPFAP